MAEAQQPTVDTSAPDASDGGDAADAARMDAILNEVLGEGEAAPATDAKPDAPADGEPAAEAKPDDAAPKTDETPQDAQLRKGFAKLATEKERLLTLQAEARTAIQGAKAFEDKAKQFDALTAELDGDVASLVLKRGGPDAIKKLLEDVVALEKSPADRRLDAMERQRQADLEAAKTTEQQRTVQVWQRSVVDAVVAGGEKYDLINSLGQQAVVIEMITQHYARTNGDVLSIDAAAAALEETLAGNLGKSKKFGPRGAAAPAAKPTATAPSKGTPAPKQTGATSLSSVHASEVPATAGADDLPLDDKQRYDAVMRELQLA